MGSRFLVVDGLRGVAALAVVCFHFQVFLEAGPTWAYPEWLEWLFKHGYMGVDIFFVLSGFVIAFSTRDGPYGVGYLGRFALRRSLRLDPPYWATIAAELALLWVGVQLFSDLGSKFPTWPQVVAHLFYAQNIVGLGDIITIFWTLCFEIQFYVFFVLLLSLWEQARARIPHGAQSLVVWAVMGGLYVLSVAARFDVIPNPQGLALLRWFQFFMGVLTWWTFSGLVRFEVLGLAWGVLLAAVMWLGVEWVQLLPIAVSALLLVGDRWQPLARLFGHSSLQFLGRTSYSLYLFHLPIGWRAIALVKRLALSAPTAGAGWVLFLLGLAVSVGVAAVAWRVLEAPSMKWSKKVVLHRALTTAKGHVTGW